MPTSRNVIQNQVVIKVGEFCCKFLNLDLNFLSNMRAKHSLHLHECDFIMLYIKLESQVPKDVLTKICIKIIDVSQAHVNGKAIMTFFKARRHRFDAKGTHTKQLSQMKNC